jgi:hypothetical protein
LCDATNARKRVRSSTGLVAPVSRKRHIMEHIHEARKTAHLDEADRIIKAAGGRSLTDSEKAEVRRHIDEATQAKDLAGIAGDIERMRHGLATAGHGGGLGEAFAKAMSDRIDPAGRFEVKGGGSARLSAFDTFGRKAPVLGGSGDWSVTTGPVVPLGQDRRFIYSNLPAIDAGDATHVADHRVTAAAVVGDVDRALTAVTQKAVLSPTVVAVNAALRQMAVVIDALPNALLAAVDGLRQVLDGQGRHTVQQALDQHAYDALVANAPNGNAGTGLVAQIRTAIGAMRAAGHDPDLLVLDPADAAALDLFEDTAGSLVFATRQTGASSPLFGLTVVESQAAANADPLLVDTQAVGALYLGRLQVDLDPFAGAGGQNFHRNLTDVRFEVSALAHVRDATAAYRIGA